MTKTGLDCKAYLNTGSEETPVMTEMKQIGDLSMPDLGVNLAPVNIRQTIHQLNLAGRMNSAVEFFLLRNKNNAVFNAIRTAFFSRTPIQVAVMDEDITQDGAEGLQAWWIIENFNLTENLDEVIGADVRLAPAFYEDSDDELVEPEWLVVAGES
jgi:hypothetical protein